MIYTKQIDGLNLLKVVLSIFVVLIHTRPLINHEVPDALLTNGVFRIAVPIFFILNGYFLSLDKDKFLRWYKKLIFLYVGLSFFYLPIWISTPTQNSLVKDVAYNFLIGWHHLWYLQALILSAGLIYIMRNQKLRLFYGSIIFFIFGAIVQDISFLHTNTWVDFVQRKYFLYRNFLTVGVPFILIGVYLKNFNKSLHKGVLILSILLFTIEISILNLNETTIPFNKDLFISLLFVCPSIVLFARDLQIKLSDKYSAKIFYFHPTFEMPLKLFLGKQGGWIVTLVTLVSTFILVHFLNRLSRPLRTH